MRARFFPRPVDIGRVSGFIDRPQVLGIQMRFLALCATVGFREIAQFRGARARSRREKNRMPHQECYILCRAESCTTLRSIDAFSEMPQQQQQQHDPNRVVECVGAISLGFLHARERASEINFF